MQEDLRSIREWYRANIIRGLYVLVVYFFFFFNDTATTEIYTLSLHDALPIFAALGAAEVLGDVRHARDATGPAGDRSEEHTSELQSQSNLVCRLLLEKKKKKFRLTAPGSYCSNETRYGSTPLTISIHVQFQQS